MSSGIVAMKFRARTMPIDGEDDCECCPKICADRCFVITVVVLISFCFFSYWYLIVIPWEWWSSVTGWTNIIALHCCFTLLCASYYKSIVTSPGIADKNYIPLESTESDLTEAKDENLQEKKDKFKSLESFYKPRWCPFCKAWKPPRAHHCREWNVCVLKLDHYCPWVYNCVGFRNHKYFVLFLGYSSLCLIYFLFCCVVRFIYAVSAASKTPGQLPLSVVEGIVLMVQMVLTLPVTIGIFSLFCFQMSCLYSNMTSIENYTFHNYKKGLKNSGIKFRWFYDFGPAYNLKQVFGFSFVEWFLPVMPENVKSGDGVTFRTRFFGLNDVRNGDDGVDIVSAGISKRQKKKDGEEEHLI